MRFLFDFFYVYAMNIHLEAANHREESLPCLLVKEERQKSSEYLNHIVTPGQLPSTIGI